MDKDNINVDLDLKVVEFVTNDTDLKQDDIIDKIKDIVYYACNEEKINAESVSVSIASATKEEIRKINKEYRNIDRATDVLSFPIFNKEELEKLSLSDDAHKLKEVELGDIILCLDVIKEQSVEYETGVLRETLYMITHAMCHLLGYDHIIDDEKVVMRALEEKILSNIGVEKRSD